MDKVHLNLERRLDELADLERKEIFSQAELAEIVKRRTAFESALVRRGNDATDWINYIEYEKRLDRLRKLRVSRKRIKGKATLSDYSIHSHIKDLYKQAVRKFSSNIFLWNHYISFALSYSESPKFISQTLASAISRHPTTPEFWLLAARWEADGNKTGLGGGQFDAARKLLLRAVRFNKYNVTIWTELVRCEIAFSDRLRSRWKLLGFNVPIPVDSQKDKPSDESAIVDVPTIDEEENDNEGEDGEEGDDSNIKSLSKEIDRPLPPDLKHQEDVVNGAVVRVIISHAFSTFNSSSPTLPISSSSQQSSRISDETFQLYTKFLDFLHPLTSSPLRETSLQHVYGHISEQHGDDPKGILLLACRRLRDTSYMKRNTDDLIKNSGKDQDVVEDDSESIVDGLGYATNVFWEACERVSHCRGHILQTFTEFLDSMLAKTEVDNIKMFLDANKRRIDQIKSRP